MQSAWKVGLFVVAFGVLLFFAYTFVGNKLLRGAGETYYATFSDAGGMQPGAIITMAGVKVGSVKSVALAGPKQARMTVDIDRGTFVPRDAVLSVPSNIFSIGEQRLELVSLQGEAAGKLPPGSTIPGVKGSFLSTALPEGQETIHELNETLKATRQLIGDPKLRDKVTGVLAATEKSVQTLNALMTDVRTMVAQNQITLHATLVNASHAVDDMRKGILAVSKQIESVKLADNANDILLALRNTAQQAEDLMAQINSFISDPNIKTSLSNTTANMEAMTRTGVDIAENTKTMTANGAVISAKAIELADNAKEITTQAKDLLARLNQFIDRLPGAGIKLAPPKFSLETGRNIDTHLFQTDVYMDYPLGPNASLFGGVYDATEKNLITLQYSQHHPLGDLRYGIYASKPGIGVDFRPTPRFGLTGDLFDPNDLTFNLRARYWLGSDIFGFVGFNKLFQRNEPIIGFGVRR